MKIGLIRHFKVKHSFPKKLFLSKQEIIDWFKHYDTADLVYHNVYLGSTQWDVCYSSSAPRAAETAKYIYRGKIHFCDDLMQLNLLDSLPNISLPFLLWAFWIRIKSQSNSQTVKVFRERIRERLVEIVNQNQNTLIVSHWFVMKFMEAELRKQMKGPKLNSPEYGKLYLFE